jgi:CRISPR-associated endonuclease Cas1
MRPDDHLFGQVKNGVLVLGGVVSSITVKGMELYICDGYRNENVKLQFSRSACPISRIISVRDAGHFSYAAARWLHETGVTMVHLNYDGTPILTTVCRRNRPSALRRAQVLAYGTDLGRDISGSLIRAKIAEQLATLTHFDLLPDPLQLQLLYYSNKLQPSQTLKQIDILGVEGMVGKLYFDALANIPVRFSRRERIPKGWRSFGARGSSLTGRPRGATLPAQAMLNYLYGVLCSEITIALYTIGLDPAFGLLHEDKDDRASLAYDLMEPARPILDRWFLEWLRYTTFSKRDFFETVEGYVRITHPLNSHLAMTVALWRGIADQLVQWLFARLAGDAKARLHLRPVDIEREATRRAKRWALGNSIQRPIPTTCMECGKALPNRRRKFCSDDCMRSYHGSGRSPGVAAMQRALIDARAKGDRRIRSTGGWTYRPRKHLAMSATEWRAQVNWSKDRDAQMAEWFKNELAPRLADVRPVDIRQATGLSASFVLFVRNGKQVPHPRWHRALADLTGVEYPFKDHNCGDKR